MTGDLAALERLLESRFSCRGFLPDAVPDAVIERIVLAAGKAPSWCNAQPWQVVITRGAQTQAFRTALQAEAGAGEPQPDLPWPDGYPGVYGDRRRTCGYQLYEAVGIARDDRAARTAQSMRNVAFFDAPHVAVIHAERALGPYGALDCGGFVTAFMLAAAGAGLGSVAQASVAAYAPLIRAHFGLQADRQVLCAISFGYADPDHPANGFRTGRAPLAEILDMRG